MSAPKRHSKAKLRVVHGPGAASVGVVLHAALQVATGNGRSLVLNEVDCRQMLDALGQGEVPPCVCAALGRARCMPCRLNGMERDLAVLRAFEEGQWSIQEQLAGEDSIPPEVLTGALTALNGLLRASKLRGEPEAPLPHAPMPPMRNAGAASPCCWSSAGTSAPWAGTTTEVSWWREAPGAAFRLPSSHPPGRLPSSHPPDMVLRRGCSYCADVRCHPRERDAPSSRAGISAAVYRPGLVPRWCKPSQSSETELS